MTPHERGSIDAHVCTTDDVRRVHEVRVGRRSRCAAMLCRTLGRVVPPIHCSDGLYCPEREALPDALAGPGTGGAVAVGKGSGEGEEPLDGTTAIGEVDVCPASGASGAT